MFPQKSFELLQLKLPQDIMVFNFGLEIQKSIFFCGSFHHPKGHSQNYC